MPFFLIDEAARRFALLSDPTRLRLLAVLLEREPLTVTELSDALGIATPNVSQHLARLTAGRLVSREKRGRTVQYRTNDPSLRPLCELRCTSLMEQGNRFRGDPSRAGAEIANEGATRR